MGVLKAHMDMTWDIARRLIKLSDKQREEIFGYSDVSRIIKNYSAIIVDSKINQYKRMLETENIDIGDVVYYKPSGYDGIVTDIKYQIEDNVDCDLYVVIFGDGSVIKTKRDKLVKTYQNINIKQILTDLLIDINNVDFDKR